MSASIFLRKEEEKPLNTCKNCKDQPCIKTGKICEKVEKLLPKPSSGRLRGEHSFDPDYLEITAAKRAFKLKFGGRKQPNIED